MRCDMLNQQILYLVNHPDVWFATRPNTSATCTTCALTRDARAQTSAVQYMLPPLLPLSEVGRSFSASWELPRTQVRCSSLTSSPSQHRLGCSEEADFPYPFVEYNSVVHPGHGAQSAVEELTESAP